jgi:hypothetical protein
MVFFVCKVDCKQSINCNYYRNTCGKGNSGKELLIRKSQEETNNQEIPDAPQTDFQVLYKVSQETPPK